MTIRNLIGDALAALDQSLTVADGRTAFDRDYWLQRAAVNAAVAQAQQSRVGNLIAWKQLRQTAAASTSSLPNAGDAIADEIETVLGIIPAPDRTDPGLTPAETALVIDGLSGIWSGDAGSYPDDTRQAARLLAERLAERLGGPR